MFFSIARLVTPILLAILSAVIEGSEITRSIIFCAVLLTFFGVFDVSPNLSAFTPNFLRLHRTFRPNFLHLQGTFRGYYLPCWLLLQQVFCRSHSSSDYRTWCRSTPVFTGSPCTFDESFPQILVSVRYASRFDLFGNCLMK